MLIVAFLAGSILCDVVGQVCFKIGVTEDEAAPARGGLAGFVAGIARSPWIAVGVVVYALEFLFWYGAMTVAPLSIVMPVSALSYCGVVLASRLILREHVSARRWAAVFVVAAGVAVVCWPEAA
jgi:drug/metabolite transporter (DMT)-like permease